MFRSDTEKLSVSNALRSFFKNGQCCFWFLGERERTTSRWQLAGRSSKNGIFKTPRCISIEGIYPSQASFGALILRNSWKPQVKTIFRTIFTLKSFESKVFKLLVTSSDSLVVTSQRCNDAGQQFRKKNYEKKNWQTMIKQFVLTQNVWQSARDHWRNLLTIRNILIVYSMGITHSMWVSHVSLIPTSHYRTASCIGEIINCQYLMRQELIWCELLKNILSIWELAYTRMVYTPMVYTLIYLSLRTFSTLRNLTKSTGAFSGWYDQLNVERHTGYRENLAVLLRITEISKKKKRFLYRQMKTARTSQVTVPRHY